MNLAWNGLALPGGGPINGVFIEARLIAEVSRLLAPDDVLK